MITAACDALLDWIGDRMSVVFVLFVLLIIGLIGTGVYVGIEQSRSPLITLKKTDWECTGTRTEYITMYVQSGKVMVPMQIPEEICVEYQRR